MSRMRRINNRACVMATRSRYLGISNMVTRRVVHPRHRFRKTAAFAVLGDRSNLFKKNAKLSTIPTRGGMRVYPGPMGSILRIHTSRRVGHIVVCSLANFTIHRLLFTKRARIAIRTVSLTRNGCVIAVRLRSNSMGGRQLVVAH